MTTMDADKANILVVDDRAENLLVFKAMLDELGYQVVAVPSGEDALKYLLEHDVAVVLLDVNMPRMDGLETAAFIRGRKRSAHTPIIFLTAYVEEMHTMKGYSIGAVDYILTPVLPDILRSKVRVFVQLYLMTRAVERQADQRIALAHEQSAHAAAEESIRRSAFLAAASDILASSLELKTVTRALVEFLVPSFAELGALALIDERGLHDVEIEWLDPARPAQRDSATVHDLTDGEIQSAIRRVRQSGRMDFVGFPNGCAALGVTRGAPAAGATLRLGTLLRSMAVLPLVARGHTLGMFILGFADVQPASAKLALAYDLASRLAVTLDNCLLYAKTQEADQRKNEFLAMLSHELRNPLAPLRNAMQILRTPGVQITERERAVDVADRQTMQLTRMVDDLLDVARVTRGKIALQLETVDVAAVMGLAVEMSRPLIDANRHELTLTVPPAPLYVHADYSRVAQILANLLNNAAKYTNSGGRISLSAKDEGADVVFRVRDSGIGIPQHLIAPIFDLFVQADRSLDRSQGGLGIGLTIAHHLVKMQGGNIEARSAGVGQGSEFVVRLPRAETAAVNEITKPFHHSPTAYRILIVDDYEDAAETMAAVLRVESHEVHIARDGPIAIEMARRVKPDVIFLDIGLPGMNGFEVARSLRIMQETKGCLLIAITGYGQTEDHQHSKEAGFDHHLVKPVDPLALHEILNMAKVRSDSRPKLFSIPNAA